MNQPIRLLAITLLIPLNCLAQWQLQAVGSDASFRAVSVASPDIAWIGGTKGTFVRTADGGKPGKRALSPMPKPATFAMSMPLTLRRPTS
ncbi:hypothetical protein [Spirosoma telluris]|uniref:hypothetical protein n=1 Tax=Spirosoma telluris TaxID=2183553 RepID=UPI002FC3AA12